MKKTQTEEPNSDQLVKHIIESIREKKGHNIVKLNMKELDHAVCDYFVICHGNSDTQVEAIAESVKEETFEQTGVKPTNIEGMENAEWVLLDYFDVVVHVFINKMRSFYQLEELWGDAKITALEDIY